MSALDSYKHMQTELEKLRRETDRPDIELEVRCHSRGMQEHLGSWFMGELSRTANEMRVELFHRTIERMLKQTEETLLEAETEAREFLKGTK